MHQWIQGLLYSTPILSPTGSMDPHSAGVVLPACLHRLRGKPYTTTLQWHHNERDGVWNHHRLDCLHNRLFRCISKKTSKLHVTGLYEGNPPVTDGPPPPPPPPPPLYDVIMKFLMLFLNPSLVTSRAKEARGWRFVVFCCCLASVDFTHFL